METCPERDKLDGHDHAMIGQTHPPLFTQNTVVSLSTSYTTRTGYGEPFSAGVRGVLKCVDDFAPAELVCGRKIYNP